MKSQIKIPDVLPIDIYRNRFRDFLESEVLQKIDVFCKDLDVYCDREGLFEDIEWLINFEDIPSENSQEIKNRGMGLKSLRHVFNTDDIIESLDWQGLRRNDPVPRIMAFCDFRCWSKPVSSARIYWSFVKYNTLVKFQKRVATRDFKKRRIVLEKYIKDYHKRQANSDEFIVDQTKCYQSDIYGQTVKHYQIELRALKKNNANKRKR